MKILKKVLSIVLVAVVLIGIVPIMPVEVEAASGVKAKLDKFMSSYPNGSRWTDSFQGSIQCHGFARFAIYNVFGTHNGSYRTWNYSGTSATGMNVIGSTTSFSSSNVKNLLSNAKCGDILQFNTTKQHTMIVYAVDSDGVWIYDCNWDNNCGISLRKSSFGAWSSRNSTKLTLMRASNYSEIDGDNYVDIGTNFAALILNKGHWKPIENNNGVVQIADEDNYANQYWWFERQSDGSYKISSCLDGTCLDVYNYGSTPGTKVQTTTSNDSTAQRWYVYEQSGGYVLKAKCTDCVLDLPGDSAANGTQLQMYTKNNTSAQIWAIYTGTESMMHAPKLSVSVGNSQSYTVFKWDDVRAESHYDLKIWKNSTSGDPYHLAYKSNSGYKLKLEPGKYYAHVVAVNYFQTQASSWVEFTVQPSYRIAHWFGGLKYGEGTNSAQNSKWLGSYDYDSYIGATLTLGYDKSISPVPNGFYLNDFGSNSITGEWSSYSIGTTVTQNASDMYFEYHYYPHTYTITYNLNGGTNASSNPSTYNVLYGFTLENPTREGYTFAGWTDATGNKVTGINPGKNASFATNSTYDSFCKELAGRTTGNQTLTANWVADYCTITYDANGGSGVPEPQTALCGETITLSQTTPKRTGYTFMGWSVIQYSDSMFGSDYFPGDSFKVTSNTVLYATWLKGCDNDHSFETTVTNPTCTDGGYTTYVCIYCDLTYNDDETAPLGHSEELVSYLAPTCTDDGYTGDIICTTCNSVFEYGETIEKLGHTYTVEVLKSPTADTKGAYEANCEVCKDYALNSLPALNDENYVIEEITKPSCEYDGLTRYTLKDTTYGEITIDVTAEKTGHSYKATVIAPTCTEGGHTQYVCSSCNDSYADSYTTATGHSYVDGICTACGAVSDETGDEGTHGSGDANGDGMINSMDANIVKRILAGAVSPTNDQIKNADLDGDGELNSIDANLLSKLLSGSN